jgi:hypothetical protein
MAEGIKLMLAAMEALEWGPERVLQREALIWRRQHRVLDIMLGGLLSWLHGTEAVPSF